MATAEELAAWIVKNADKKGTPDFETVAAAYKEAKSSQPEEPEAIPEMDVPHGMAHSFVKGASFNYIDAGPQLRKSQEAFQKEHPVLSGAAEIAGGIYSPAMAAALIPESIAAGSAGLLAKGATYLPESIQALKASRWAKAAGSAANSIAQGAGYGALAGSGEAGAGHRLEGAKEGAGPGALFGAALHGAGKVATGIAQGAVRLAEPLIANQKKAAQRAWQRMFPEGVKAVDSAIPGAKPLPAALPQGAPGADPQAVLKDLAPDQMKARIAENEAALRSQQVAPPGSKISAPGVEGQKVVSEIKDINAESAAQDAAALERAKLEAQAATEKNVEDLAAQRKAAAAKATAEAEGKLKKFATGKEEEHAASKSVASEEARARLDQMEQIDDDAVKSAWNAHAPETVPFRASDIFKRRIRRGLTYDEQNTLPKGFLDRLSELDSGSKLSEVQSLMSDLKQYARDKYKSGDYAEGRVARKLDKQIFDTIQNDPSVLHPNDFATWEKNIGLTRDYYSKWDNYITGKYLKDESLSASPEETLNNFLTGKSTAVKYKKLMETITLPNGQKDPIVMESIKKYLAHDLADTLGGDFSNQAKLAAWQKKYADITRLDKNLMTTFGDAKSAIKAAAVAADEASQKIAAKEIEALGLKVLPKEVKPTTQLSEPVGAEFLPKNPYDPKSVKSAMEATLRDDRPDSMKNFMELVGDSPEALNGTKRILGDMMLEHKSPHEFIANNREKLNHVFKSPEDQAILDQIARGSKEISAETAKVSAQEPPSVISLIATPAIMTGLKMKAGYYASILIAKTANALAKVPAEERKKLIVQALLDPNGAGKALSAPIEKTNITAINKSLRKLMPGLIVNDREEGQSNKEDKTRYASGGAVYTPPAISAIRANRAKRSADNGR